MRRRGWSRRTRSRPTNFYGRRVAESNREHRFMLEPKIPRRRFVAATAASTAALTVPQVGSAAAGGLSIGFWDRWLPWHAADISPAPIIEIATGFMSAKFLLVANELGLFEKLAESPATLDELAQRIGIPRRTTRMVAD